MATAMVPRGVVRTTAALAQGAETPTAHADETHLSETPRHRSELPGVRVVVSREDHDVVVVDAIPAGLVHPAELNHTTGMVSTVATLARPSEAADIQTRRASRAPPRSS